MRYIDGEGIVLGPLQQLENPIWQALTTTQSHLAVRSGNLLRYLSDVAPFCTAADPDAAIAITDFPMEETVYYAGPIGCLPAGIVRKPGISVPRMIYPKQVAPPESIENETELYEKDAAAMVGLTDIAFPGFFRSKTIRMGRYFGIRLNGELVSMAGERMRTQDFSEVSGVCTLPGHTGKGYARHLMFRLMFAQQANGQTPFLHVAASNTRARAIYDAMGFVEHSVSEIVPLFREA